MTSTGRRGAGLAIRAAISVGVLGGVALAVDAGEVLNRLHRMQAPWVALAAGVSVLQVAVSAWRWRFTADRLGIDLSFRTALREYYLATFLNQVVPGGVAGDVSRAWRHAEDPAVDGDREGAAVRAVLLERASGQAVMIAVAGASLAAAPSTILPSPSVLFVLAGLVAGAAGLALLFLRHPGLTVPEPFRRLAVDARAAVLARDALPAQLLGSCVVVGTYLVVYVVAARAVGAGTPVPELLPLVAPVLVAMLIPVSVAGWGVREGAAAAIWAAAGLPAAEGVAVSVSYGVLVLLSSAPGALVLARAVLAAGRRPWKRRDRRPPSPAGSPNLTGGPGRTARPRPEGSVDRAGGAPRRGTRPAAAPAPDAPSR